jgi:hypothetical protein
MSSNAQATQQRIAARMRAVPQSRSVASDCDCALPWHNVRMGKPVGFEWTQRKNGDVVVTHHARVAAILRGRAAIEFVSDVGRGDPQEVMARVTGNYKRGNERSGRRGSRSLKPP